VTCRCRRPINAAIAEEARNPGIHPLERAYGSYDPAHLRHERGARRASAKAPAAYNDFSGKTSITDIPVVRQAKAD
jgi:hypothetical protein